MNFEKIYYRGEEVKGFKAETFRVIVMQQSNPDRLDMRYKCNKEFVRVNEAFSKRANSETELDLKLLGAVPYE